MRSSEKPQILSGASDSLNVAQTCKEYSLTETQFTELQQRAIAAKATAYCPYSGFRVGATLLSNTGQYVDGANVENASYPVGTCAERVAFGKAVTEGRHRSGFKALAVATDISPPASPCGMCRQLYVSLIPVAFSLSSCCDFYLFERVKDFGKEGRSLLSEQITGLIGWHLMEGC